MVKRRAKTAFLISFSRICGQIMQMLVRFSKLAPEHLKQTSQGWLNPTSYYKGRSITLDKRHLITAAKALFLPAFLSQKWKNID